MKKVFILMLSSLFAFTLFGCESNNNHVSKYYINEKISVDDVLKDAKELADKINDIDSVQSELGINKTFNEFKAVQYNSDFQLNNSSDEIDITNNLYSYNNQNLFYITFLKIEDALNVAKHSEFLCFENHIAYINEWEYWGDGNGQVRILYDKNDNSFTWEKYANETMLDASTKKITFKHDGSKEYTRYTTKLNSDGKLEISNASVFFNENTKIIKSQNEFLYVEDEYFEQKEYYFSDDINSSYIFELNPELEQNNYTSEFFNVTHIGLSDDNKYFEDYLVDRLVDKENKNAFESSQFLYQKYFDNFIYNYSESDDYEGNINKNVDIYNYSLEKLLKLNSLNDTDKYSLNVNYLDGYSKITYNPNNYEINLYNVNNEKISLDDMNFDVVKHGDSYDVQLSFNLKNNDEIDELIKEKGLSLKNDLSLSNIYNLYKDSGTKLNTNNLNEKIESFEFYDKNRIDDLMKKSTLTPARRGNDVESEITGEVKLENGVLDLSNIKIVIDKGNVYTDEKEYNYGGLLWIDGSTNLEFVKTSNYKCNDGKIIIDNLGKYDITKFKSNLLKLDRVCLMFMTYDPRAAIKISLCDIILDTTDGNINGTPVPLDLNITDFTKK